MSPQPTPTPSSSLPYVAPFAGFIAAMALEKWLGLDPRIGYPLRCLIGVVLIIVFARRVTDWRPSRPAASVLMGIAVCAVWIAPDALFGYRDHWLFSNSVMGKVQRTLAPELAADWIFLATRALGSALVVPIVEELFWRAWLMRWVANTDFWKLPLGYYAPAAFWITAALFASEHGPFWEVGLAAGALYNWWLVRTRNLADCILAHAVTNGALALYVLTRAQWQYWL
jgi:uncharacterized protein